MIDEGTPGAETLRKAAVGYEVFLSLEEARLIIDAFNRRWGDWRKANDWVNKKLGEKEGGK